MSHLIGRGRSPETYPRKVVGTSTPQTINPLTATWFVDGSFGAATPDGSINAPYPSLQAAFDAAVAQAIPLLTLLLVAPDATPFVRQAAGNAIALRIVGLGPYLAGVVTAMSIDCANAGPITLLENLAIDTLLSADNPVTLRRCIINSEITTTGGATILFQDDSIIGGNVVANVAGQLQFQNTTFKPPQNMTADVFTFDSQSEESFFNGGSGAITPVADGQIGTFEVDLPPTSRIATDSNLTDTAETNGRIIYPEATLTVGRTLTLQVGTGVANKSMLIDVWPQGSNLSVVDQTSAATIYTTNGGDRLVASFDAGTSVWSILLRSIL